MAIFNKEEWDAANEILDELTDQYGDLWYGIIPDHDERLLKVRSLLRVDVKEPPVVFAQRPVGLWVDGKVVYDLGTVESVAKEWRVGTTTIRQYCTNGMEFKEGYKLVYTD